MVKFKFLFHGVFFLFILLENNFNSNKKNKEEIFFDVWDDFDQNGKYIGNNKLEYVKYIKNNIKNFMKNRIFLENITSNDFEKRKKDEEEKEKKEKIRIITIDFFKKKLFEYGILNGNKEDISLDIDYKIDQYNKDYLALYNIRKKFYIFNNVKIHKDVFSFITSKILNSKYKGYIDILNMKFNILQENEEKNFQFQDFIEFLNKNSFYINLKKSKELRYNYKIKIKKIFENQSNYHKKLNINFITSVGRLTGQKTFTYKEINDMFTKKEKNNNKNSVNDVD